MDGYTEAIVQTVNTQIKIGTLHVQVSSYINNRLPLACKQSAMFRLLFVLLSLSFTNCFAQQVADTAIPKYPQGANMPVKFSNAVQKQADEFAGLSKKDSKRISKYTPAFVLDKIDNDSNYQYLHEASYWIVAHYREMIPELIQRIINKKEVGLSNAASLIIEERIESGQLKHYGEGDISQDDLFTISGRANRLLTQITGEDFGHVSMKSSPADLQLLQQKWISWLKSIYPQ